MGADVFIVHASTDRPFACRLAAALKELGVSAFVDAIDVEPGTPWDEAIGRGLRDSLVQAVLLGAGERWYQREEIGIAIREMRAIGAENLVVPILLQPREQLPYGLNRVQAIEWHGPEAVAAALAAKVQRLRGEELNHGGGAVATRRIRLAVLGLREELADTLDKLRVRLAQRTAILDGEVRVVDLAQEAPPAADLSVLVIGGRHAGQLARFAALLERSLGDRPDTIAGGLAIQEGKLPRALRSEARECQDQFHDLLTIKADTAPLLIDDLDEAVAGWYVARYPSQPGRSAVREPWEERYLQDKAALWRQGTSVGQPSFGGEPPPRARWFVHLKASTDQWIAVAGEVRFAVARRIDPLPGEESSFAAEVTVPHDPAVPPALWWRGGPIQAADQLPTDAWLDPIVSHALLPRCVLIGLAGAGKTVLLEHLASVLASDEPAGDPASPVHRVDRVGVRGDSPIAPIPVLHTATTLVAHLRCRGGHRPIREALVELLVSSDTFGDAADRPLVRAGIDAGRYLFLIDSLDEVPLRADRAALVRALGGLLGAAPRVILTTRPGVHTDVELPTGFARVELAALDEEAADRLVVAWVRTWKPDLDLEEVRRAVAHVRSRFPTRADERSPVENPLLLGSVLQVYAIYRRLPDDVAKLYADMVTVLCTRKLEASDDVDRDAQGVRFREALRDLFRASQEDGGTRLAVAVACELVADRKYVARGAAEAWLQRLANQTGLIRFEGAGDQAVLRPWHRSYQEYLAAESIALEFANRPAECVAWLRAVRVGRPSPTAEARPSRLKDPVWRDTLAFLVGAAMNQTRDWGVRLVEKLLDPATEGGGDQGPLYRVAAEALAQYAEEHAYDDARRRLEREMVPAFERGGEAWPRAERLAALEALGRLGDPRLDPNQRALWVPIDGGTAVLGEGESARAHEVAAFELMWRPITVADYRPFVKDVGYWSWFHPDDEVVNDDEFRRPEQWDSQLEHGNRPVVGVSWYEVRAFCRWASERWSKAVTLPTEVQWEYAARAGDGREYPWGPEEPGDGDAARANHYVGNRALVGHPSSVGAFPGGDQRRGSHRIIDLAGNVREWCLDPWDPRTSPRGAPRVVRGGSWAVGPGVLRCAYRGRYPPRIRGGGVGFRVVVSGSRQP